MRQYPTSRNCSCAVLPSLLPLVTLAEVLAPRISEGALWNQSCPSLVSSAETCLRAGTSAEAASGRRALATIGSALLAGPLKDDFEAVVLKTKAPLIMALVREDERGSMLILPVMRLVDKEEMTDLVKHLRGCPACLQVQRAQVVVRTFSRFWRTHSGKREWLLRCSRHSLTSRWRRSHGDWTTCRAPTRRLLCAFSRLLMWKVPNTSGRRGALFVTVVLNDAHRAAPGNAIPDLKNVALLDSSKSSFHPENRTDVDWKCQRFIERCELLLGALLLKERAFEGMLSSCVMGNLNAPAPAVSYVAPAPAVNVAPSPVVAYIAPEPAVQYAARAPAITYAAPALTVLAAQAPAAPAPAVTYAAPALAITYAAPALTVLAAQAPAVTYAAPAPAVTYAAPALALTYAAPALTVLAAQAPAATYAAPALTVLAAQAPAVTLACSANANSPRCTGASSHVCSASASSDVRTDSISSLLNSCFCGGLSPAPVVQARQVDR